MTQTPPDWYPDPSDPGSTRYWDGAAWTTLTRPVSAPPPAGPPAIATEAFAPKRSRRGLWITLGVVGVLVIGLGVAAVVLVAGEIAPISQDYSGAPVTASDVAPAGFVEIISDTNAVAVEIPEGWVDASDYMDLTSVIDSSPPEVRLIGVWLTGDPNTDPSFQLILVTELPPVPGNHGTLDDAQRGLVNGTQGFIAGSHIGSTSSFTTHVGLEGRRTDISLDLPNNITANIVAATLAHGRRLVFVSWTAYDHPPDQAAITTLLESLRVDA